MTEGGETLLYHDYHHLALQRNILWIFPHNVLICMLFLIIKCEAKKMIEIRNANMNDASILHLWRNDEKTRGNSHNTEMIDYDSHVKWLEKVISSTSRDLLIAEQDGIPVGTARVDFENNTYAELSWTVSPEFRGRGLAKEIMKIIFDKYKNNFTLRAEVKENNIPSIKVAEFIGMKEVSRKDGVIYFQSWRA